FEDHVFGVLLLNDWSARDIQAFEYQPLGPFLGKSFATSVAPWVVPLDALAPFMVPGWVPRQDPEPAAYLRDTTPHMPALRFEVLLTSQQMRAAGCAPVVVSTVALEEALYWSMPQQLAHATVNGASVRTGDVFATGTLSGPDPMTQAGSLIERTWRGECPLVLPTGETRAFLADGDEVTLRGWCGAGTDRVDLGEVTGVVRGGR
ncbi:MAG TPA: fumarylacetoacetate hydrolase family protein, partial [Acidimicrobiia bacterium]|nr:fumarylacetoacetate hydrolase family protein [Acidimicrobiia bacterium]